MGGWMDGWMDVWMKTERREGGRVMDDNDTVVVMHV